LAPVAMKIGLYFGSFNPIHVGHLIVGNTMVEHTDLQQVWYIVSPQNPLKKREDLLHEFDRLNMVELAIASNPNMRVSDVEFNLPRPSYTIDTLTYLQEKHPQHQFALIIGEDNLVSLPKWKNYEAILEYFSLYVYPRIVADNARVRKAELREHAKVKFVDAPLLDISATFIRRSVQNHLSIAYLVHEAVEEYIKQKKFYL
jgi:nicotinate-nucleotide adenylyltransferase